VQSSAAVMAITILLCSTGVLPIYLGIALVMGENIGTTATANLAALGAGTEARRTALAHLVFNVFGVIWVLLVFYPFVDFVCSLVGYDPAVGGQVERLPVVLAMFHTCFNVANTTILIGFIPQLERIVRWLLPEKQDETKQKFKLQYIESNLIQTPEIAVLQAQKETARFADSMQQMFIHVGELFDETDDKQFAERLQKLAQEEEMSDEMELGIAHYLEKVSERHLSDVTKQKTRQLLREIGELESIGDSCYKLGRSMSRRKDSGKQFTDKQNAELKAMMELCNKALEQMCIVMHGHRDEHKIDDSYKLEEAINQMRDKLKNANLRAVDEHAYDYALGTMFVDLIGEMEKLGDYVMNVVQARFGK